MKLPMVIELTAIETALRDIVPGAVVDAALDLATDDGFSSRADFRAALALKLYSCGLRASDEWEIAARFALLQCEKITQYYSNCGDFWGLADNAAREIRAVLAGGKVSEWARTIVRSAKT